MTQDEMRDVLKRILELDPVLKSFSGDDGEHNIQPMPGANSESLRSLAQMFPKRGLPPSYRMLLEIHNGIKNFKYADMSLLSAEQLLRRGHDARAFSAKDKEPNTIFFIVGEDWEGVAFDTTTLNDGGEMVVAEYSSRGKGETWPSLREFLRGYLDWLEAACQDEVANRKRLDD